jgi:putative ATP-binding cassette transporter
VTGQELDEVANDYLRMLDLADKVRIHNGTFSTTALSQGQRKRLALVTAYLENRPVYVFDEWAADQDPQYKEVFYTKLLPGLTRQGKAVVVVTHDDRYFYMGHRVIKLQDGQIVDISTGPRFKRGRVHPIA